MYEFEIFKIDSNTHVKTCYGDFYKKVKDKDYIKYYHQLFTYAFLVGLKENKLCNEPKTHDMFMISNIDKKNFDMILGIALVKIKDVNNGKELLDKIMQYADGGIEILKKRYEIDNTVDNISDYI